MKKEVNKMKILLTLTLLSTLSLGQLVWAGSCPFKAAKNSEVKAVKSETAVATQCSKAEGNQFAMKMTKCKMGVDKKAEMRAACTTDSKATGAMAKADIKKCADAKAQCQKRVECAKDQACPMGKAKTQCQKRVECAKDQACPMGKAECSQSKLKCESKQSAMCVASDRGKQELKDSAEGKSCPMTQEVKSVL